MPQPHANRADANGNRRRRTVGKRRQGHRASAMLRAAANEKIMDFALNFLAVEVSLHKISGTRKIQSKLTCRSLAASLQRQTGSGGTGRRASRHGRAAKGPLNKQLMVSFENDYNNGAHPKVLQRLVETNEERTLPYGADQFSESAKAKIMAACDDEDAVIFFLTGGTQTNATVIDSLLRQYEGVVAADSGHINVHEAGAIEFTGHKVITLPGHGGKMRVEDLDKYLEDFNNDENNAHSVFPGLVYITLPTELGTLYSTAELDAIYRVCRRNNIPLYVDGARLGYGLAADGNDITLPYLARHCDAFYIGGTKAGALCGEAVVFTHRNAPRNFFTIQKQHGALMAKGRLLGAQFDALFTDGLYFDISRHAIDMAKRMRMMFEKKGYRLWIDSPTNQQFVIIGNDDVERLSRDVLFTHWGKADENHTVCRFVTSWATTEAELEQLQSLL